MSRLNQGVTSGNPQCQFQHAKSRFRGIWRLQWYRTSLKYVGHAPIDEQELGPRQCDAAASMGQRLCLVYCCMGFGVEFSYILTYSLPLDLTRMSQCSWKFLSTGRTPGTTGTGGGAPAFEVSVAADGCHYIIYTFIMAVIFKGSPVILYDCTLDFVIYKWSYSDLSSQKGALTSHSVTETPSSPGGIVPNK